MECIYSRISLVLITMVSIAGKEVEQKPRYYIVDMKTDSFMSMRPMELSYTDLDDVGRVYTPKGVDLPELRHFTLDDKRMVNIGGSDTLPTSNTSEGTIILRKGHGFFTRIERGDVLAVGKNVTRMGTKKWVGDEGLDDIEASQAISNPQVETLLESIKEDYGAGFNSLAHARSSDIYNSLDLAPIKGEVRSDLIVSHLTGARKYLTQDEIRAFDKILTDFETNGRPIEPATGDPFIDENRRRADLTVVQKDTIKKIRLAIMGRERRSLSDSSP